MLEQQIEDITFSIEEAGREAGQNYSVKQMEKTKKSLQAKLQRLNDQTRKDDVVTFEQLGVDRLFVDESHNFKNLFLYTKMRNVAGISQTDAQKSSDMFMKCRYMDELTGGRGIVFATGTPVSNSMTELYTIMRYLQYDTLMRMGMGHFDSWAATFGETVTAIELSPEGTGYRAKTRFARFFNLPELISIFKEAADIQTSDMLNLPVPDAEFINEVLKPSEEQQDMVAVFSERAESVRAGMVNPTEDNMLKITNDGRKCALDQRLLNELLPDAEKSKVNTCIDYILMNERKWFLMEHEEYGPRAAYVVLSDDGAVVMNDNYNGLDAEAREKIQSFLKQQEEKEQETPPQQQTVTPIGQEQPPQQKRKEPELANWQKVMDNGEYLRSAEMAEEANYNMIDGLMNNVRKVKDKDKPRESVLAKLRLNQKKVAKQGKKQTQQKAMTEDMERKKK